MGFKYEAIFLPASGDFDPSKTGFKSEEAAWEYIETMICRDCKRELTNNPDNPYAPCTAEWMVDKEEN
jgi:hypothetical protein